MKKYIFSLAVIAVSMAVFSACEKKVDLDDPNRIGDGSPINPFKVATVADLKRVASDEIGPGGFKWESNKHYRQVADINLNNENWNPIRGGLSTVGGATSWFKGSYDGDGYAISNLTITGENNYVGLFGNTDGVIRNVRLSNVRVSGKQHVGCLVGFLWTGGTIEHCSVNNIEIYANSYLGGLVGSVYNNATVHDCMVTNGTVTGTLNGTYYLIGGVVGENVNGTIKNCYATVDVSGQQKVGGITGHNGSNGTVQYCYATGNITSMVIEVGGIAGTNIGKISNCVALSGQIRKTSAGHLNVNNRPVIGRIVGSNTGTISNNYARSDMALTANAVAFTLGAEASLAGVHGATVYETDYYGANSGTWWSGTAGFPASEWSFGADKLPWLTTFE